MVVVLIIGVLTLVVLPNYLNARTTAQKKACIVNLTQIAGAKEAWAFENRRGVGTLFDFVLAKGSLSYLKNSVLPVCSAGGSYTANPVAIAPVCSQVVLGHTY